jgi:hypothetical protein
VLHHAIILAICVFIIIGAFVLNGDEAGVYFFGFALPMQCPLHQAVGLKCSLCGLTRSVCLFAHGNFSQSFKLHAIGPAIFAFIVWQIPYRMWAIYVHPRQVNRKLVTLNSVWFAVLLAAIFVNWLIYLGGLVL